jgi:hypothetical protein
VPRRIVWLAASAAVLWLVIVSAAAACARGGYVYAGIAGRAPVSGVGADIFAPSTSPRVGAGHVAAWVGVGGPGEGPHGSDEWIQVGFSALPLNRTNDLYYEVARPGAAPVYTRIRAEVVPSARVRVSVLEMRGRPGRWRIWVNGSPVTAPIDLPSSHGRWRPVVTAESWDGMTSGCNDFRYRFTTLRVVARPGGAWTPLAATTRIASPSTVVVTAGNGGFIAAGGHPARALARNLR